MPRDLTRRGALGALTASTVAMTASAMPKRLLAAPAAPMASNEALADLWHKALVARGTSTVAHATYFEAHDRLPWWVLPGPGLVDSAGKFCGAVSHSPAIQDYQLPEDGVLRRIRFGENDIQSLRATFTGLASEEKVRAAFDQRMEALRQREAAAEDERRRLNLPALSDRADAAAEAAWACEDAILQLPATTLDVLAAQVLVNTVLDCSTDATPGDCTALGIAAVALRGLLPFCTGELAVDVAELVNNPDRPISSMRASRGIIGGDVA